MLGAGRFPVRVSDEADFNLPNSSIRIITLGSTQPLTKTNIRNFLEGKKRPEHRLDKLASICLKMWEPQTLATLRASTVCTGITSPFTFSIQTMLKIYRRKFCVNATTDISFQALAMNSSLQI
jgi:hypothetical protein